MGEKVKIAKIFLCNSTLTHPSFLLDNLSNRSKVLNWTLFHDEKLGMRGTLTVFRHVFSLSVYIFRYVASNKDSEYFDFDSFTSWPCRKGVGCKYSKRYVFQSMGASMSVTE